MARADYEHWNEDADYMWWHEEGKHVEEEPFEPDDDVFFGEDDRDEEYDDGDAVDPYEYAERTLSTECIE